MTSPHKLAPLLIALGTVFLAVYALPTAYGTAMAHLAVAQFRAQTPTHRLWDSARIRAYRRTLNVAVPPPEAILRIPRLGLEVPILEGTSELVLNRAAGHIPGTALPGQPGNLAIAGHRDGFFRPLKDLTPGDLILVETPTRTDRYQVGKIKIVFPGDTSVLNRTTASTLTLVTCYPFYFVGAAPQRYIVEASILPPAPTLSGD